MILSLWESWSKTNGMSRGKICSNLGQGQFWNYISVKSFQSDAMCPEQDWSKRQRWALRTSPEGQEQSDRVQVQEAFWPSPAAVSAQWTVRAVDLESWNSLTREVLGKLQIILTFCGLWSFGCFFFFKNGILLVTFPEFTEEQLLFRMIWGWSGHSIQEQV